MCDDNDEDMKSFLLTEYDLLEKEYELQFDHFMKVFYFWIAVVSAPMTAGIVANLGLQEQQSLNAFGILCVVVAVLGIFVSLKMFDIRQSQWGYIQDMNRIRKFFWEKLAIPFETKLSRISKKPDCAADLLKSDFARWMALIMAFIHGALLFVGMSILLSFVCPCCPWQYVSSAVVAILALVLNWRAYYWLVVDKLEREQRCLKDSRTTS